MPEPSWRTVAFALADRMENYEHCNTHDVIADGISEGCPFCRDREAMRVFRAKSGMRPVVIAGAPVPIEQVRVTGSEGRES